MAGKRDDRRLDQKLAESFTANDPNAKDAHVNVPVHVGEPVTATLDGENRVALYYPESDTWAERV